MRQRSDNPKNRLAPAVTNRVRCCGPCNLQEDLLTKDHRAPPDSLAAIADDLRTDFDQLIRKLVRWFQMAEVAVSRQMFEDVLILIARVWAPPACT
jgi:hypothetical protein